MMSATASESVNIMRWLTSQMTDGSDANKVVEIKKAMAAQRKMSDTIIATGQETIRQFISSTAALEQSTAAKKILVAQAEEEHAQAVAAQSELQERCDAAQVKRAAIESEAAELVANHDEMVAQTEAVQKEATEKSRIAKNALSLYVNITHILWDYDSEEKVAGYVSNATTERVIPFDIDATTTSEFDVAAQLWESVALASNVEAVVAC